MKIPRLAILGPVGATLLLTGCGLFGNDPPEKVSGDAAGVIVRGGSETDRRELAANHCGSFGKSALVLPPEPGDRPSLLRISCR
jgi:hypothetical protein